MRGDRGDAVIARDIIKDIEALINDRITYVKPDEQPYFPDSLIHTPSEELETLQDLFTRWKNHLELETAATEALMAGYKTRLELTSATEQVKAGKNPELKAEKDRIAFVNTLPHIQTLKEEMAVLTAQAKIQEAFFKTLEHNYWRVTNEIDRRRKEWR